MSDKLITLVKDKNGFEFFVVTFSYDKTLVEFVKKIPTRKYVSNGWKIRADHVTARYIEAFARKLNFDLDAQSKAYIERMLHPVQDDFDLPTFKQELRNFQRKGVQYALKYERCFIADEMGLGKSCQSIAAVETLDAYPCLIICPASLKLNWKKEISKWMDRPVKIVDGLIKVNYETILDRKVVSGYDVPDYDADFVVINYDILYRDKKVRDVDNPKDVVIPDHKDLLKGMKFKSIIIDECHMISNHKSLRTKAVKEISRKIRYRYALSGTPILNRPKELLAQLDVLDRLDTLGGFWTFAKRYCGAYEGNFGWDFSGATNLDELYDNMKKTCFIRRRKEDVLDELPPKERILLPVELSNAKEYETASKNFRKWMKMTVMNESEYYEELKNITSLTDSQRKMVAKAKATHKLNQTLSAEALVKIEKLKQLTAKGKLERVYEFINNFLSYDEKLIVFAKHQEIYKKLIAKYKDICVYVVCSLPPILETS